MKKKPGLLLAILLISSLLACKKENNKPASKLTTPTQPLTESQVIAGKWFVVKDSTQTLDFNKVIPNLVAAQTFGSNDFITFNADSTAKVSSYAAFNAFYPNYTSSNVTSTISVSPILNPDLNFKYGIATMVLGNGPAEAVYGITLQNTNTIIKAGFQITVLSSSKIMLYNQEVLPTINNTYTVNQYIYLQR